MKPRTRKSRLESLAREGLASGSLSPEPEPDERNFTAPQCKGLTQKGTRCKARAAKGSSLCKDHRPDVDTSTEEDNEATALLKQGSSGKALVPQGPGKLWEKVLDAPLIVIRTYDDVMKVLSAVLQLEFMGQMDKDRATTIVNVCKAMLTTLDANSSTSVVSKLRVKLGVGKDGSEERTFEFEGIPAKDVAEFRKALS